jgi:hypothetical protein
MIFDTGTDLWRALFLICGGQRVFVDDVEFHNVVFYDDENGLVKVLAIGHDSKPLTVQEIADSPKLAALAIKYAWELPDGEPAKTFARIPFRGKVTRRALDPENRVDMGTLYEFVTSLQKGTASKSAANGTPRRNAGESERAVDAGDKSKAKTTSAWAPVDGMREKVLIVLERELKLTPFEREQTRRYINDSRVANMHLLYRHAMEWIEASRSVWNATGGAGTIKETPPNEPGR